MTPSCHDWERLWWTIGSTMWVIYFAHNMEFNDLIHFHNFQKLFIHWFSKSRFIFIRWVHNPTCFFLSHSKVLNSIYTEFKIVWLMVGQSGGECSLKPCFLEYDVYMLEFNNNNEISWIKGLESSLYQVWWRPNIIWKWWLLIRFLHQWSFRGIFFHNLGI